MKISKQITKIATKVGYMNVSYTPRKCANAQNIAVLQQLYRAKCSNLIKMYNCFRYHW